MLSKYVWSISVKKIIFIRSCYGRNKSDRLHNKGPYTRGNIKWRSFALRFCASNHKSAWQPLLPSVKGLSFTFMQESVVILLIPTYSLVGKHCVLGKDLSIYGHANIFDHELLLLTIIYMISKLGGETLSPYLSMCSIDSICSKNMLWVVEIMEDYDSWGCGIC